MTTPRPSAARALPARTSGRASAIAPAPATTTGTQGNSFCGGGGGGVFRGEDDCSDLEQGATRRAIVVGIRT